jgi:tetratricopeptide (TPR) repeat protein
VVRLKPGDASAYHNLGISLNSKGEHDAAIAAYREAIRLKPGDARVHYRLGLALRSLGEPDEAIAEFREAVRLDGDRLGAAIWTLGDLFRDLDRFDEAITTHRRAREIGRNNPADVAIADEKIAATERAKVLFERLDAVLKGTAQPKDGAEADALVGHLTARKRYSAGAQLYTNAFAADRKLAENLNAYRRYNAACAAALAGSGAGKDDSPPDDSRRARLREQALGWLRADLAARGKVLDGGDAKARQALVKTLDHWKKDTDLAGIRDEVALSNLPEGEREAFRSLWAEVDRLLAKARAGAP